VLFEPVRSDKGEDCLLIVPGVSRQQKACASSHLDRLSPAFYLRLDGCRVDWRQSIAGWLQVVIGDRNILLPVADLAEILGVQKMTVSRYRKWAIADGLLKEVAPAAHHPKARKGKATEFRFNVERVPMLKERAAGGK
jgi:hypothetical protein